MHTFDNWLRALEERHLADLTFPEVSRALRALSSAYVERRGRLKEGAALSRGRAPLRCFWSLPSARRNYGDIGSGRLTAMRSIGMR